MKTLQPESSNKTTLRNKTMYFTKLRFTIISSFILTAMFNVIAFSSSAFAQTQAMQVSIDVVPNQSENNISLGTSYAIPVAILSGGSFDAATVNPETLRLAGGPVSKDDNGELSSLTDINGDGVQDMLVYFAADYTELNENSTEVILNGFTADEIPLQGIGYVRCTRAGTPQAKVKGSSVSGGSGPVLATVMVKPAFILGYTDAIYNYVASFFAPEPAPIATPVADTVTPFTNNAIINIPASGNTSGSANPYPSQITVSNVTGNVKKVTVTLNGISHSGPDDIDILLVGPTGKALVIMSDAGGSPDITNLTLTLDDTAAEKVQDSGLIASNNAVVSFKPTNHATSVDNFVSPAPASSTIESPGGTGDAGTAGLSVFNGLNPNGIWKLFVRDDANGDIGSISRGWTLNITTEPSDTTAPTLTLPSNITAEATSASGREITYTATATDANPASPTVNCNPASGSTFAIATTTVNCSATDDYNNTANGSFTVTVRDTTAPQITASNITVNATSASGASVSFNGITATDAVASSPSLAFKKTADNSPVSSGATFSIGTTNVTVTATDGYNNSSNATFNVIVNKLSTNITGLIPSVLTYGQSVPQTASVQGGPTCKAPVITPI